MLRGRVYPRELHERVIRAVQSGLSRRAAAARFDVGISTAINWCNLYQATDYVESQRRGGNRKRLLEPYDEWIKAELEATPHLTVLKLTTSACRSRCVCEPRYSVAYSTPSWAKLQKKACSRLSRNVPMLPQDGIGGKSIKANLILRALCFSMRLGSRPIWRQQEAGARKANN